MNRTNSLSGLSLLQTARVDGGAGIDTLRIAASGGDLNISNIKNVAAGGPDGGSRISSIEKIDLASDAAANTLTLSLQDVVDMTGMNLFNTSTTGWANATGTALSAVERKHQLVINGNAAAAASGSAPQLFLDNVDIVGFAASGETNVWTKELVSGTSNAATVTHTVGGVATTYEVWNHNSAAAQLLIQQGVSVI
ncbi:MAG: hypothetical protein VKK32_05470 [Candidatus Melainabacteria bacterium]|nr:hypothetical protein [Candidatus Melainabacteria bacterium]